MLCCYSIYGTRYIHREEFVFAYIACMEHLHTVHAELIDHMSIDMDLAESGAIL
jgi:hypothetical protein